MNKLPTASASIALDSMPVARASSLDAGAVLDALASAPQGLSDAEAAQRRSRVGRNVVGTDQRSFTHILIEQSRSGINALLAAAGVLTLFVGGRTDSAIILGLLALNIGLSIVQECRAERALAVLRTLLPTRARVWRNGQETTLEASELVPGDSIAVRAGDLVPADARLLEAEALEVNQATLTGESLPQTKGTEALAGGPPMAWTNVLFAGTTVVSGSGRAIVCATGVDTQFGETASLVRDIETPSDFQRNLSHFGGFLLRFGLLLALVVFAANALLGHGVVASLTLALALMLGAVPEALPAVTATTLAIGSARLARRKVLVRRLAAVEDLSVLDVLCLDKTGTITESRTAVTSIWTRTTPKAVLEAALLCSSFPESGSNIVDDAIAAAAREHELPLGELSTIPRKLTLAFNSERKYMSVIVEREAGHELIVKGAAEVVLQRCTHVQTQAGDVELGLNRGTIDAAIACLQGAGARAIAVASLVTRRPNMPRTDDDLDGDGVSNLALIGVLGLADPPRPGAAQALARVAALGMTEKIVTGDTLGRARALAAQVGIGLLDEAVVEAAELRGPAAGEAAERGRIFAEVIPADKFRLVRALQASGHRVGMTGDGVNDAPALEAADVGIALASGSDAAKGAADLVLLDDDLSVIVDGVEEGRRLFTNLNRYLLYTMVSNFANVMIVAVASLFLSFLPLLPEQVLLLSVLSDLPMLAIVTDRVSSTDLESPRHWDIRHVVELTLFLGIANALFAFGLLRMLEGQRVGVIYAAWFLLLGTTALLILLVVRSSTWFWRAPLPSRTMMVALAATLAAIVLCVNLHEMRQLFGFSALGWRTQVGTLAYSVVYVLTADLLKHGYLRLTSNSHQRRSESRGVW